MIFRNDTPRQLHHTIHIIRIATLYFNLNGAVSNTEMMLQFLRDPPQHVLSAAHALLIDHDVAATTDHAGAYSPHMQVVNRKHAMHAANGLFDIYHIHALRYSFQEDVD
jgi:hypothetical protein